MSISLSDSLASSFGSLPAFSGSYEPLRRVIATRLPDTCLGALALDAQVLADDERLRVRLAAVDLDVGFLIVRSIDDLVAQLPHLTAAAVGAVPVALDAVANVADLEPFAASTAKGAAFTSMLLEATPIDDRLSHETALTRKIVGSVLHANGWLTDDMNLVRSFDAYMRDRSGSVMSELPTSFADAVGFIASPFARSLELAALPEVYGLLALAAACLRVCEPSFSGRHLAAKDWVELHGRLLAAGSVSDHTGVVDYRTLVVAVRNARGFRRLPTSYIDAALNRLEAERDQARALALRRNPLLILRVARLVRGDDEDWVAALRRLLSELPPEAAALLRTAMSLAIAVQDAGAVDGDLLLSAEAVLALVLTAPDGHGAAAALADAALAAAAASADTLRMVAETRPTTGFTFATESWAATVLLLLQVTESMPTFDSDMVTALPQSLRFAPSAHGARPTAAVPGFIRVATCNIDSASDLNVIELCTLLDEHDVDVVALQETAVGRVTTLGTLPEGFHSIAIPSPTPTRSGDGRARRGLGFIARRSTFRSMFLDTFDPVLCAGQVDIKETETAYVRLQLHDGRIVVLGSLYSPPVTFAERPGLGRMEHSTAPEPGAWEASIGADIAARGARASVLLAGDFNEEPNFGRGLAKCSLSMAVEGAGLRLVVTESGEALPTFRSNSIDRIYASGNVVATTTGAVDRGAGKHRLLIADVDTLSLGQPVGAKPAHRLRLARLRTEGVPEQLLVETAARLKPLLVANSASRTLESTIVDTAKDVLGTTDRISTRRMVSWWTQDVRTAVKARVSSRRRLQRLRRKMGRAVGARALQLALDAVEEARSLRQRDRVARQAIRIARRKQQEDRARQLMLAGERGTEALRQHFESTRYRTGKKSAAAGPSAHRSAAFFRRLYSDEPLDSILTTSMDDQAAAIPVATAIPALADELNDSYGSSSADSYISLVSSSSSDDDSDRSNESTGSAYTVFSEEALGSSEDDDGGSDTSNTVSSQKDYARPRYFLRSQTLSSPDSGSSESCASTPGSSTDSAGSPSSNRLSPDEALSNGNSSASGSSAMAASPTSDSSTSSVVAAPSAAVPTTPFRYALRSRAASHTARDSAVTANDVGTPLSERSSPNAPSPVPASDSDPLGSDDDSELVEVVDALDDSDDDVLYGSQFPPTLVLSVCTQDAPPSGVATPTVGAPPVDDNNVDALPDDGFTALPAPPDHEFVSPSSQSSPLAAGNEPPATEGSGAGGDDEVDVHACEAELDRTGEDGVLNRWRDSPLSVSGTVTEEEVLQAVAQMAQDKAPGVDLITGRVLRALCTVVEVTPQTVSGVGKHATVVETALARDTCLEAIRRIIDEPFRTCVWPDEWKEGLTVVIPKGKVSADPKDGRGITLLPLFDKLAQRVLTNRLHQGGRRTAAEQAGFVPTMGALQAAASATNLLADRKARGLKTLYVSVDVQKAFDRVEHSGIIAGLRRIGGNEHLCDLVRSLLHGRRTRVLSNGELSETVMIGRGVPQGGVVSPFLFNVAVDRVYELLRPEGIVVGDGPSRRTIGGMGFADDTLLITDEIAKAQTMVTSTDQFLKTIGCDTHPGKLRFVTSNVRVNGTLPAGAVLSLRGVDHKPVESLVHLGCYVTGDAIGRRKRNADRIARMQRWDRAATGWKLSIDGLRVPMWIARMSFLGGLASSALYGVELDSVCWTASDSGVMYDLTALDQRFTAAMARVAGFSKRGGSRDLLSQITGIPPLLDWLFVRIMRLLFMLKHSTCPLQRLLLRQASSADVGLPRTGRIMLAQLGLDDTSLISRMVNPFARTSDDSAKDLKRRLEGLILSALARNRDSSTAPWLRETTRQATRLRTWPVQTRMAPGLRYAGLGARSAIHLMFGTLAARRGRSAKEANDSSWCHLCGLRGGDNAEHTLVHCLHPSMIALRASLDARDILLILSSFAYDLDRSVRCTRSKKKWIARVAGVVDDIARLHADAFHGKKPALDLTDGSQTRLAQIDYVGVLEMSVRMASAKARIRNQLFDSRVTRLDRWTSVFRGYAASAPMEPVTIEREALPDVFDLDVVPAVLQAQLRLPHDVGVDPTEIAGRRAKQR